MIIHLSYAEVLRAARYQFLNKNLQAQNPESHGNGCKYRTKAGRVCVIGASLTQEQAAYCDAQADSTILGLIGKDKVTTDNITALDILQKTHDNIINEPQNAEIYLTQLEKILFPEHFSQEIPQ